MEGSKDGLTRAVGLQSGVVIASTEAVLVIPPGMDGQLATVDPNCATLLAVEAPAAVAPLHGVCTFQREASVPASHSLYHEVHPKSPKLSLQLFVTPILIVTQVSSILYQETVQNLRRKGALVGQGDDARAYIYTGSPLEHIDGNRLTRVSMGNG